MLYERGKATDCAKGIVTFQNLVDLAQDVCGPHECPLNAGEVAKVFYDLEPCADPGGEPQMPAQCDLGRVLRRVGITLVLDFLPTLCYTPSMTWEIQKGCHCDECSRARLAILIRETKKSFPEPEYDWEDLERQDKESRRRDH